MAKKKTSITGITPEHFTAAEMDVLANLAAVYVSQLSADGDIGSKHMRRFSRGGLYEIGITGGESWLSKLLTGYKNHTIAENLIVAHGYIKSGF